MPRSEALKASLEVQGTPQAREDRPEADDLPGVDTSTLRKLARLHGLDASARRGDLIRAIRAHIAEVSKGAWLAWIAGRGSA